MPKPNATPPVELTEVLYRQAGPGGDPLHFDLSREPPVHHALFLPSPYDIDGLSLIRARFRSPIWSAFRPQRPHVRYRLIQVKAGELIQFARDLGLAELNFDLSPDDLDHQNGEPWAHCVICAINRTDYDTAVCTKRRIKSWAATVVRNLTEHAVIGPFERAPTANDPYRP